MSGSTTGHSRSHIVTLLDVRDVNFSVLYHTGYIFKGTVVELTYFGSGFICFASQVSLTLLSLCPLAEQQYISDILGFIGHGDPQIRGATAILCGAIIQAVLTKTRYNIHTWLASVQSLTG